MGANIKVVTVSFSSGDGMEYSYFTDLPLAEGDLVVVEARASYSIAQVFRTESLRPDQIGRATKWIVQKIDTTRITELKNKLAKIKYLREKLEDEVTKALKAETLKKIAKKYPDLAELTAELDALESEVQV